MTFVVHVRGCSGAGKSTLVRQLVRNFSVEALHDGPPRSHGGKTYKHPIAYRCPGADGTDLYVVGRYHADHGGGVDGIHPIEDMQAIIECYAQRGHAIHESLIGSAGGIDGKWAAFRAKYGDDYHFVYLDTPWDVAVQRVYQRNGGRPIKEDQVRAHHKTVNNGARRLKEAGADVRYVPHAEPFPVLLEYLAEWGWAPSV